MDSGEIKMYMKTKKESFKRFTEIESESGASSEEIDSPKSVWRCDSFNRRYPAVHHQVLKIREEDLHLGEDIGEGQSAKEKLALLHLKSQVDALIMSRPILPASPLGGKGTAIRSFH